MATTAISRRAARQVGRENSSRRVRPDSFLIDLATLSRDQLQAMAAAGREVLECDRVLAKSGSNVVAEVLPPEGAFREFDHCPPEDVFDPESQSQYYYHSHRPGEHGHFHVFLREAGMPPGVRPVAQSETDVMKQRDDRISHLVAISMDEWGVPIGLFTTNRWVTGENWYAAADVAAMLDRFCIDHPRPSWPTNRWVTAMLRLFRPQIVALLHRRDAAVGEWRKRHRGDDVFEDRKLDLPSQIAISVDKQVRAIEAALGARAHGDQDDCDRRESDRYGRYR